MNAVDVLRKHKVHTLNHINYNGSSLIKVTHPAERQITRVRCKGKDASPRIARECPLVDRYPMVGVPVWRFALVH